MKNKLEEITETDPMRREANRGLMVAYINADLSHRVALDVHKSIVFYDEDRMFETATQVMPTENIMEALAAATKIRYWSKGIV